MPKPIIDQCIVDKLVADFSRNKRSFILSPKQWRKFKISTTLSWQQQPLLKSSTENIPETRGVYAHSIILKKDNLPPTAYITYVGLVGDKKSTGVGGKKRNLRQRFKEYLEEQDTLHRPLVWEILKSYKGFTWFFYAEVTDTSVSLHQIETALLDAILPPCNQLDFSVNIQQAHKIVYQ